MNTTERGKLFAYDLVAVVLLCAAIWRVCVLTETTMPGARVKLDATKMDKLNVDGIKLGSKLSGLNLKAVRASEKSGNYEVKYFTGGLVCGFTDGVLDDIIGNQLLVGDASIAGPQDSTVMIDENLSAIGPETSEIGELSIMALPLVPPLFDPSRARKMKWLTKIPNRERLPFIVIAYLSGSRVSKIQLSRQRLVSNELRSWSISLTE